MATRLSVGEIINGTLTTVRENVKISVIYIAVLSCIGLVLEWGLRKVAGFSADDLGILGVAASYLGLGAGLGGLLFLAVAIIANYLLWERMLRQAGAEFVGERRVFRFVGQGILVAMAIGLGLVLLIVPGLIVGARLAVAPAFLIAERRGVTESMGDSWETIKGNTTPVVLAFIVGSIIIIGIPAFLVGVFSGASAMAAEGDQGILAAFLGQVISNLGNLLTTAFGVFLFGRLHGPSQRLVNTFA